MNVVNHTPFPAQVFAAIDQHDQQFHVGVLRQTLSFAAGALEYADEQAPLCDTDVLFAQTNSGGVRQESDYCPFKPHCDVIVNATAYAPKGIPSRKFNVRLRVMRGATSLIEKSLVVTGERSFKKKSSLVRLLQWLLKWGTLTLLRPIPWKLTRPERFTSLALRYDYAFGGECRVNAGDAAAPKVRPKHRLAPSQELGAQDHGSGNLAAVAHTIFENNVIGCGFAEAWYLRATRKKIMAAPRIENPEMAITAKIFWDQQVLPKGSKVAQAGLSEPAGFGIRNKSHPSRRTKIGLIDDAFVRSNAALPADFDFALWNAAPADQQIDYLRGGETFELTNLCRDDTIGAQLDALGNIVLSLSRPEHECYALVYLESGEILFQRLLVDTVLIEPDECRMTLVWRAVLPIESGAALLNCEFRMREFDATDRIRRTAEWNGGPSIASHQDPTVAP